MAFYVYQLEIVETGQVVYVGKGSGNRLHDHARAIRRHKPTQPLHKRLQEAVSGGFSFRAVKVLKAETEYQALKAEEALINRYGKDKLWNTYVGGGGCTTQKRSSLWLATEPEWRNFSNVSIASKYQVTPESARTFRCRHDKGPAPARTYSARERESLRSKMLGRKLSEETRRKMSESRTGDKHWRHQKPKCV